ncbi:MAG: FtsW/RodA/SpoVE family cell cycle protein [Cardiobacteriaceae bacterium]|nr:FtsW/RodA/SpoVE family cell cycle protein [Cardiobacteriaceae bacterium]
MQLLNAPSNAPDERNLTEKRLFAERQIAEIRRQQREMVSPWYGLAKPSVMLSLLWLLLILMGVVMQFSVMMHLEGKELYSALAKMLGFLGVALLAAFVGYRHSVKSYRDWMVWFMVLMVLLSLLIFVPGLGHEVNGAKRWLRLGGLTIQVSEMMKWVLVMFSAHYLALHFRETQAKSWKPLGKLIAWYIFSLILLFFQKDLGTIAIVMAIMMGFLILIGVPLLRFGIVIATLLGLAFIGLAQSETYRMERILSFLNPSEHRDRSGFQPSAALEAQALGHDAGWFGRGLGQGSYKTILPESSNDFIYANIGEELGLFGLSVVWIAFVLMVVVIMKMGLRAYRQSAYVEALYCYGVGLWFGAQAFLHMGVNVVLLPTKGMTLPFVSSGGSSLVVSCFAVAIVLRADSEVRGKRERDQAQQRRMASLSAQEMDKSSAQPQAFGQMIEENGV